MTPSSEALTMAATTSSLRPSRSLVGLGVSRMPLVCPLPLSVDFGNQPAQSACSEIHRYGRILSTRSLPPYLLMSGWRDVQCAISAHPFGDLLVETEVANDN